MEGVVGIISIPEMILGRVRQAESDFPQRGWMGSDAFISYYGNGGNAFYFLFAKKRNRLL